MIGPRSGFHPKGAQGKKYRAVWITSPVMSTFQHPPSPSIILQQICSASCAETILDQVPSNPLTVSLKAGSAVFFESRHPRIAYRADAMGVKTVERREGDGSVLSRIVWRVEMQPVVPGCSASTISSRRDDFMIRKGWWT